MLAGEEEELRRIPSMRATGSSFQAIATALNADGIRPRRGLRWHPYAFARIVERALD
jgi:hypothetical protein